MVIAGPTAVGKTAASIELAKKIQSPIVSFDSRQFYREMNIGTAKPDQTELNQVQHYFINSLSIHDHYTAGQFELDALKQCNDLFKTLDVVIAVGGSGLYINALCYGIDEIPTNELIRNGLIEQWQSEGLEKLSQQVKEVDPEFYQSSDMQNPRRVIRALEVFKVSGLPYSHFRKNQRKQRAFETLWLGLNSERNNLFDRINNRVDTMIQAGLEDEALNLHPHQSLKTLRTVGYQEFFDYFNGKENYARTVELIKRNTRNFAKKQIAWFARNAEINWCLASDFKTMENLIHEKIHKINF